MPVLLRITFKDLRFRTEVFIGVELRGLSSRVWGVRSSGFRGCLGFGVQGLDKGVLNLQTLHLDARTLDSPSRKL